MQVVICPECGIEVNAKAGSCGECGVMFSDADLASAEERGSDARELAKAKGWVAIARTFYLAQATYFLGVAMIAARAEWVYGSEPIYAVLAIVATIYATTVAFVADRVTVAPRGVSLGFALMAISDFLRFDPVTDRWWFAISGLMTAMSCLLAWMLRGSAEVITRNPHLWDLGIRRHAPGNDLASRLRSAKVRPWIRVTPFLLIGIVCSWITLVRPERAELLMMRRAEALADARDELDAARGRLDESVARFHEAWNRNDVAAVGSCFAPDRKEKLVAWLLRPADRRDWTKGLPILPEATPQHVSKGIAYVDYELLEGSLRVTFHPDPGDPGGWRVNSIGLR